MQERKSAYCVREYFGFGQEGPYRLRPGFDQIAQGMGGLMWITGLPGQGPVRVGVPIADLASGLYAALGILTALLQREEDWGRAVGAYVVAGGANCDAGFSGSAMADCKTRCPSKRAITIHEYSDGCVSNPRWVYPYCL